MILIGLCGFLGFKVHRQNQEIGRLKGNPQAQGEEKAVSGSEAELETQSDFATTDTSYHEDGTGGQEAGSFNPYFDEDRAFSKDELFAVTSKQVVPAKYYEDLSDVSTLGTPKKKSHPPVYVIHCLGRETRENYLFIVDQLFYQNTMLNQKFTREQLSSWEKFLSEEKMERLIFTRRLQNEQVN